MKRPWLPALVLFFAAPAVGELLCGNMPPSQFFSPAPLLCVAILYGGGAILIREAALRWRKGWPTILALGAAFAVTEEGLMVKSFFNPEGPAKYLGTYGWSGGINWPWAAELTIYHAVQSIAVPILLVELLFPQRRGSSWTGRRTQIILLALLAADVLVGFFFFGAEGEPGRAGGGPAFRPPLAPYLAALAAVALLVLVARRLSSGTAAVGTEIPTAARPIWFGVTGFGGALGFFLTMFAVPRLVPPAIQVLIAAALACFVGWLLGRLSRGGAAWTDHHRFAVIAGDFCVFILLLPIIEFNQRDAKRGVSVVALATVVFLLFLWRHVRRRAVPG